MGRKIDISEIAGAYERDGRAYEVCATAEGAFDDETSQLELTLDCFLRPGSGGQEEPPSREPWMPPRETVREGVPWEESHQLSKDIFHHWAGKVRQSIPSFANP